MVLTYKPSHETPSKDVVKLMVLETDEPHADTIESRGSFGEILFHHMFKAGQAHHPPLGIEVDYQHVVTEKGGILPTFDDMARFDGLLITGSVYDAHGGNQWILDLLSLLKGKKTSLSTQHELRILKPCRRTMDKAARFSLHWCLLRSSTPRSPIRRRGWSRALRRLGARPLQN